MSRPNAWTGTDQPDTKSTRKLHCTSAWTRLEDKWNEIQVGRQGSYSVERLESLYHYCSTTSPTRVALVCVFTPCPALAFLLLLECLPLRSPDEGWSANWMFWVRLSLMVFTLAFVGISDMILFIPKLGFTFPKRVIVALGCTIGYVGTCLLAAATNIFGFPIPFIWQFGGLLIGFFLPIMLLLVLGFTPFRSASPFRQHFSRYIQLTGGFMALAGVYPLYKVVYDFIPVKLKGGTLVALPLWKFAAKHFMMRCSRELEDFIPMIIALTVDLFSALFVTVCISSSGSLTLSILFIATDIGQALLEFREVRANSLTVLDILHETASEFHSPQESVKKSDLLAKIIAVTRNPNGFNVKSLKFTRLWACLPHSMSPEQEKSLSSLENSNLYGSRGLISTRRKSRRKSRHRSLSARLLKSTSIVPSSVSFLSEGSVKRVAKRGEQSRQLVVQGLQLLFHCEYLALVEYIECVVPLVVATHNVVLNHLPNAEYYPASNNWGVSAVLNILVFAALEIASLLLLHFFLQRKFDFSPLYQLAFALETQMYLVQALLFLEIVALLQYELIHLGADFTFRFEWLHKVT